VQGFDDQGAGTKNLIYTELSGGTDDDWDTTGDGDIYRICLADANQSVTGTSGESDLWTPEYHFNARWMTQTQAEQYRDMLLAQFEKVASQQSFTVTSPFIKDGNGAQWPLWEVIKQGGGYIQTDVFPEAALLSLSLDSKQATRITALDYNYRRNRLRILPDNEDGRLDAILKRGKLVKSTQVQA